jgi:hypothetical protein
MSSALPSTADVGLARKGVTQIDGVVAFDRCFADPLLWNVDVRFAPQSRPFKLSTIATCAQKPLILLASLIELDDPWRMVVFLIDQTEVFFRPRHTDVEKAPCLAKTGRSAAITRARDIAGIRLGGFGMCNAPCGNYRIPARKCRHGARHYPRFNLCCSCRSQGPASCRLCGGLVAAGF